MTIPSSYPAIQEALLEALREHGGTLTTTDAYPAVTAKFPGITDEDLLEKTDTGKPKWINRIQFARQQLIDLGKVDGTQRGIWKLVESSPIADTRSGQAEGAPRETTSDDHSAAALIDRLATTSHDSQKPSAFEEAVAAIFTALGFHSESIGGSGDTDVLVQAILGHEDYSAVVDCKTTAKGSIANSSINWPAIRDHKQKHGATYAAVVATSFASGNLVKFAADFGVGLIEVQLLTDALRLHERTPFSLLDLEALFSLPASEAIVELQERSLQHDRRLAIGKRVLDQFEAWAATQPDILPIEASTLRGVLLASSDPLVRGATIEELADVLVLLTTEPVAILRKTPTGSLALSTSAYGARQRLQALTSRI